MAIEWHYVSSDGSATWANSTSNSTPCSLDTALANVTAGIGLYLKAGTYTRTATDTIGASGSETSPILMVGCDASWNVLTPSRNATTKLLDTTNYPHIYYDGSYGFDASDDSCWHLRCLKISGARTSYLVYLYNKTYMYGCACVNTASHSNAYSASLREHSYADNCDFACTGASCGAALVQSVGSRAINCVIYQSANHGILILSLNTITVNCVIYGHTGYGIYCSTSPGAYHFFVYGCTIYGGKGFATADIVYTAPSYIGCCHITDGSGYAFYNPNATGSPLFLSHNRTRDNSSGLVSWAGDGVFNVGGYNSDTGDASDDFKDYANDNFALKLSAIGASLGQFGQPIGPLPPPDRGVSKSRVFGGF